MMFTKLLMFVLAVGCFGSCGMTLIIGQGWEQALGFGLFSVAFLKVCEAID